MTGETNPSNAAMGMLRWISRLCSRRTPRYTPVRYDEEPSNDSLAPATQRSGQSFVNYITVVIFLEFFAWGLVTTILPEAIKAFFGVERMWLVLGLTQGLKGFLSFLSAPLLGAMSDKYGRKPFLLLTVACTCLPLPFLLLHNLWWHIVAVAVSGAFAVTFSIVFAYVSDVTSEEERSAAFGQVSATFAASLVISPALGSVLVSLYGSGFVFFLSTLIAVADVVFIIFFLPESLYLDPNQEQKLTEFDWKEANPLLSLKTIFSSSMMLQWSLIVFFSYLPEAGQYQCIMLYFQNSVGFNQPQLAAWIAIVGILSIVAQTFLLSWLTAKFSPKNTIITGLVIQAVQLALYGLFQVKWMMFAIGVLVAASSITYPAISAFLSKNSAPEQQGAVQGMVTGIRSLCTGLGPALFGALFQLAEVPLNDNTPRTLVTMQTQFPGAPFLVGAGCVMIALVVALNAPEKLSRRLTSALSPRTIRARDLLDGSFSFDGSQDDSRLHVEAEDITMRDLPTTPPSLQHRTGSGGLEQSSTTSL
eukprot:TRINITY_DN11177_c0_g3_i1.p1 TRINITY_DN11177_c0_g3~~TRINITY_DN11177_c0_g3_i1.p1  ORF type:complete len:532 (+),score=93.44 TRINITY_DN11177_c0_g3_i1:140-1735(+)